MDRFDRTILSLLAQDGKMTSAALGEAVGLSPSATHRRIKALEAQGAIKGYAAIVADDLFGPTDTVFVSISLENQKEETMRAFEEALTRCTVVRDCHLMSGENDYLLTIEVNGGQRYDAVHREVLSKLPGVQRMVSSYTIRTIFRRPSARGADT